MAVKNNSDGSLKKILYTLKPLRKHHIMVQILQFYNANGFSWWLKNSLGNAGDTGSIHGLGRSSGKGNGNPVHYFCPENYKEKPGRQ